MAKVTVNKSIKIDKPIDEVYKIINDFHTWTAWSPWLVSEPNAKVTIADDNSHYAWEGDRVGSGEMKIVGTKENASITIDLTFLKPWKSFAKTEFFLKAEGNQTNVTWTLENKLPFFMFWMKNMMSAWIGMDYMRGLSMLKDLCETGEIPSKLEFTGIEDYDGCNYIGVQATCKMDELAPSMEKSFGKMHEFMGANPDAIAGAPFCVYHKWEIVKGMCTYSACIPVKEIPASLPAGTKSGSIPKMKVHTIKHEGAYKHLGNAWSTQQTMSRGKEFKYNKKVDPFEIYLNDPQETAEKELLSAVCFPVK